MEAKRPPRDQHVVSKSILDRFGVSHKGSQVITVHRTIGNKKAWPARSESEFHHDFIKHRPEISEAKWIETEGKMGIVYEAIENGVVGTEYWEKQCTPIVLELIALHFVRSKKVREIWVKKIKSLHHLESHTIFSVDKELAHEIRAEHPDIYKRVAAIIIYQKALSDILQDRFEIGGRVFQDFLHKQFERCKKLLADKKIDIGIASSEKTFISSDNPVLLRNSEMDLQGQDEGIGINNATEVLFPLDSLHLAAVLSNTRPSFIYNLTAEKIDEINRMQIKNSIDRVYYRPDKNTQDWIESELK